MRGMMTFGGISIPLVATLVLGLGGSTGAAQEPTFEDSLGEGASVEIVSVTQGQAHSLVFHEVTFDNGIPQDFIGDELKLTFRFSIPGNADFPTSVSVTSLGDLPFAEVLARGGPHFARLSQPRPEVIRVDLPITAFHPFGVDSYRWSVEAHYREAGSCGRQTMPATIRPTPTTSPTGPNVICTPWPIEPDRAPDQGMFLHDTDRLGPSAAIGEIEVTRLGRRVVAGRAEGDCRGPLPIEIRRNDEGPVIARTATAVGGRFRALIPQTDEVFVSGGGGITIARWGGIAICQLTPDSAKASEFRRHE